MPKKSAPKKSIKKSPEKEATPKKSPAQKVTPAPLQRNTTLAQTVKKIDPAAAFLQLQQGNSALSGNTFSGTDKCSSC